jgi:hypothetical protein
MDRRQVAKDESDQPVSVRIISSDSPRQKPTEEAILANNRLMRTIIDSVPGLVAYVDAGGLLSIRESTV